MIILLSTEKYEKTDGSLGAIEVTFDWQKLELHCMKCSQKSVWEAQDSERDYASGNRHICSNCGFEFYGTYNLEYDGSEFYKDTISKLSESE